MRSSWHERRARYARVRGVHGLVLLDAGVLELLDGGVHWLELLDAGMLELLSV